MTKDCGPSSDGLQVSLCWMAMRTVYKVLMSRYTRAYYINIGRLLYHYVESAKVYSRMPRREVPEFYSAIILSNSQIGSRSTNNRR